jgi:hypothetical protein
MGSLLITYFCNATLLMLCGVLSLAVLGNHGLCRDKSLTCVLVGDLVEGQGVLLCGKWCLFVCSGLFGGKEIIGLSRIWRDH